MPHSLMFDTKTFIIIYAFIIVNIIIYKRKLQFISCFTHRCDRSISLRAHRRYLVILLQSEHRDRSKMILNNASKLTDLLAFLIRHRLRKGHRVRLNHHLNSVSQ